MACANTIIVRPDNLIARKNKLDTATKNHTAPDIAKPAMTPCAFQVNICTAPTSTVAKAINANGAIGIGAISKGDNDAI